jgi:CBS domain containing-hemolysin-like protein
MIADHTWTCIFYVFVAGVGAAPFLFVGHYWHEARTKGWSWTSQDSRNMYVDGAKTIITASGIAVALLASSSVSSVRTTNGLVAFSAKVAVVCLISCVCLSLVVILALLRGHERAKSRYIEEQRKTGNRAAITEGKLNTGELLFILVPSGIALSCFLVGFVFLGRVAFHF